uniref:Putative secreted protein n=1 Tax=Anopheles triannulatus TaxID=58253 RepID=A0A2M4B778_9DIPT
MDALLCSSSVPALAAAAAGATPTAIALPLGWQELTIGLGPMVDDEAAAGSGHGGGGGCWFSGAELKLCC